MNRLTRYHALAFMVLCLLVAAALRLPGLPQAPPGLHYDEAANAILSADIGLRGERPIFIPSYTGKEPLFFYLAGAMMYLVGESVFALRLTAAFVGLLTIATTYWLGRELLADRRIAILAAALLAVSFWHVLFSRLGFRAITQPLLQALTIAALFRGMRRDDKRWLIAGGLFLGLAAYTYLAVRVFPFLLFLTVLPFVFNRSNWRLRWQQLALFLGVAILVLLPLLGYFVTHPDTFWVRIGQVSPSASQLSLQDSFIKSLSMFFLVGDPFWRFNLPARPLFNWFWGGLLVVGWIIAIWRWRRFPYDWQRATLILLITAPLVMLLPTALATGEIVPSNLRAIGLIPFIFYLPALGVVILFHDLEKRFGYPPVTFAVLFVGLLILLSGGLSTYQTYFEQWAKSRILLYEADGDLAAVAKFLDGTDLNEKTVYVAAPHYQHPTVAFLSANYELVNWLPGSNALVFPAEGAALIVYPHNSPAPAWTRPYLSQAASTTNGHPHDAFTAYTFTETPTIAVAQPTEANFGDVVSLIGFDMGTAAANDSLPLTLFWQVNNTPPADYTPFVHLEDAWGKRWSQVETFAYPAEQWQPGEIIIQHIDVPIPPGTPPGDYRLRVGLFEAEQGTRLPLLDANGRYAGDTFSIDKVPITTSEPPAHLAQPPFALYETVRPGLRLLGYERGATSVTTGEPWGVALWWQANQELPAMTVEFVLVDRDGNGRSIHSTQPVHDTYPFDTWPVPQFVIDHQTLQIPDTSISGDYQLHLNVLENDEIIYTTDLGALQITPTERSFTPPPMTYPFDATLGNEIQLLGYDLVPETDNNYQLSLVWQALTEPTNDYTVFVHLLYPDGRCCVWQQDSQPQQNQYPTNRWLTDEVIVDNYQIELPPDLAPGEYPIEVGLYIAETGQRLQVVQPGFGEGDVVWLRPLLVEAN